MYRKNILMVAPACVTSIGIGLLIAGCDITPPPPCVSSGDCDDGDSCTVDTCDSGICNNVPLCASNAACNDGNTCTSDVCVNGCCMNTPLCMAASDCDDQDPSTTDVCLNGCCANRRSDDLCEGMSCDDADPCNGAETCVAGRCVPGTPPNCADGDPCTTDSCDSATGCAHDPVVCGDEESCVNGVCVPFDPCFAVLCDDFDPCTTGACVVESGEAICEFFPVQCPPGFICANGSCVRSCFDPCDDGDACTENDRCANGFCVGTTIVCDIGFQCVDGDCLSVTSELHGIMTGNVPIPPGITGECPNEVNGSADLTIALSGGPAGSVVTSVQVRYELAHLCHVDLRVRVHGLTSGGNSRGKVIREACDVGGGCGGCTSGPLGQTVSDIHDMDGLDPNQDWHLSVDDCWSLDDVGALTFFEIWVEYSSP